MSTVTAMELIDTSLLRRYPGAATTAEMIVLLDEVQRLAALVDVDATDDALLQRIAVMAVNLETATAELQQMERGLETWRGRAIDAELEVNRIHDLIEDSDLASGEKVLHEALLEMGRATTAASTQIAYVAWLRSTVQDIAAGRLPPSVRSLTPGGGAGPRCRPPVAGHGFRPVPATRPGGPSRRTMPSARDVGPGGAMIEGWLQQRSGASTDEGAGDRRNGVCRFPHRGRPDPPGSRGPRPGPKARACANGPRALRHRCRSCTGRRHRCHLSAFRRPWLRCRRARGS